MPIQGVRSAHNRPAQALRCAYRVQGVNMVLPQGPLAGPVTSAHSRAHRESRSGTTRFPFAVIRENPTCLCVRQATKSPVPWFYSPTHGEAARRPSKSWERCLHKQSVRRMKRQDRTTKEPRQPEPRPPPLFWKPQISRRSQTDARGLDFAIARNILECQVRPLTAGW